jgi:hypothetical protein
MIYIGLVALFTLIGLTAYKTKNKEIEEKSFSNLWPVWSLK